MTVLHDHSNLDQRVRAYVYDRCFETGRLPAVAETAAVLALSVPDMEASFQRLADAHLLVLQRDKVEILMAMPFSAVPTPFWVQTAERSYFGNCIWDAMGIPAMLGQDAVIQTSCPDCGTAMTLEVIDGTLQPNSVGFAHFALPARQWWDEIVFT